MPSCQRFSDCGHAAVDVDVAVARRRARLPAIASARRCRQTIGPGIAVDREVVLALEHHHRAAGDRVPLAGLPLRVSSAGVFG